MSTRGSIFSGSSRKLDGLVSFRQRCGVCVSRASASALIVGGVDRDEVHAVLIRWQHNGGTTIKPTLWQMPQLYAIWRRPYGDARAGLLYASRSCGPRMAPTRRFVTCWCPGLRWWWTGVTPWAHYHRRRQHWTSCRVWIQQQRL